MPWHFFTTDKINTEPVWSPRTIYSGKDGLFGVEVPSVIGVNEKHELVELNTPGVEPYFVFVINLYGGEYLFITDGLKYAFLVNSWSELSQRVDFTWKEDFMNCYKVTDTKYCSFSVREHTNIKHLIEEIGKLL